ncbi:MAG: Putrescine transport ATP-binding protein PotA [Anaerolineae bacterium]|nr:MAG: Putrescine transport ATP-binding protein PotA [Anaerolineae bacterium]
MAFLEINNVSKYFGKTTAVKDFNLKVEKGELVSFLGPSGCGKTTTLRMVAGFEVPSEGQIIIDGKDMTFTPPNQRPVGMVFQAYALFPNMTVAGNIGFGLKIAKKPKEEIEKRVKEMLELIHMPGFENRYPHQLSGGQQQRVALARALAMHPEVLLLDEPLSALDAKIRVSLRAEIRAIQQELGITTIYVTHDQEEALSISDRVVVMNNARIEQIGTPFQIYNFPQTEFVAQFVGTLNAVLAEVVDTREGLLRFDGQQVNTADKLERFRNGDKIMVAIRPERLSFASEGRKANILKGTIKNITFLGSIVRIQVQLGENVFYVDTFNNPYLALPKVGDPTEITCSKEAVLVLQQQPE